MEEAEQEDCGVSFHGDIQKTNGDDPGHPEAGEPALAVGLGWRVPRGPFQLQPSCD